MYCSFLAIGPTGGPTAQVRLLGPRVGGSLAGVRWVCSSVGWQVTLCDPIWQLKSDIPYLRWGSQGRASLYRPLPLHEISMKTFKYRLNV